MDTKENNKLLAVPAYSIGVSLQHFLINLLKFTSSILKIFIQSKRATPISNFTSFNEVVVLGNGPSAKDFLEQKQDFLAQKAILAVNFFVRHEKFYQLKPSFYVLADPAFFMREEASHVLDVLASSVDWKLLLLVPSYAKKQSLWQEKKKALSKNSSIKIAYFNMTKIDGFNWFVNYAVIKGWGLPAPRNVLVPSIANCIRMRFNTIYLAGADHSWFKQLWINDHNEIVIEDKHSYDTSDSKSDTGPSTKSNTNSAPTGILYMGLESIAMALKSYIKLNQLAMRKNIQIYNITQGSFIDVFERLKT